MVYVPAGGSVDFAAMLAAPTAKDAQGADGARPKKTPAATVEKSSDNLRSAAVVSTPPRTRGASAFARNPAPPPHSESRQSTPSEPLQKRRCVQCCAEVDDTWGQMSVGTVSAVSTPGVVPSPPAKVLCLKCAPKSFLGSSAASVVNLPEAPPWPGSVESPAVLPWPGSVAASATSAAVGGAGARAEGESSGLASGLQSLSLESPPPREGKESRVHPVLREATEEEQRQKRVEMEVQATPPMLRICNAILRPRTSLMHQRLKHRPRARMLLLRLPAKVMDHHHLRYSHKVWMA